jgi:hypothetical protein
MRRAALVVALVFVAGCSSGRHMSSSSPLTSTIVESQAAALKAAVSAYATNYFAGHGDQIYEDWSARCQAKQTKVQAEEAALLANEVEPGVTLTSYSATISGNQAYITTTSSDPAFNRTHQSWLFEGGTWRWDGC